MGVIRNWTHKPLLRRNQTFISTGEKLWCKCSPYCFKCYCDKHYFIRKKQIYLWDDDTPCHADRLDPEERWLVTEFEVLVLKGASNENICQG